VRAGGLRISGDATYLAEKIAKAPEEAPVPVPPQDPPPTSPSKEKPNGP